MPAAKTSKPAAKTASRSPELQLVDTLAEILNATGLTEIELEQKGVRVRVSKSVMAQMSHVQAAPAPMAAPSVAAVASAAAAKAESAKTAEGGIKSPMVGTVYLAASPETPPFITVGASVKQGQTLLIIEAMKTMNQIPAPRSGKVTQINVENGQPVEYGEVLLVIE